MLGRNLKSYSRTLRNISTWFLVTALLVGCGGSGTPKPKGSNTRTPGTTQPVGGATSPTNPGGTGGGTTTPFPGQSGGATQSQSATAFQNTVFPLVEQNCADCHGDVGRRQNPRFAQSNVQTAHDELVNNQKVDFANPDASRLVQRLSTDFHFCWTDCASDAAAMRAAVAQWASLIGVSAGTSPVVGNNQIVSLAVTLADGSQAVAARADAAVIAKYEFKEGSGTIARDTSGIPPAMDLTLNGTEWLGGQGIQNNTGKGQASAETSRKLADRIALGPNATNQYSIEAWLAAENVTQEGPARIITYAADPSNANFMMGQVRYSYAFRNRSTDAAVNANGNPLLQTADADMILQPTLQHMVMTFDQTNRRRIFVNGQDMGITDSTAPAPLSNWNTGYVFTIGNIATDTRLWKGQFKFVAVHERALTPAEVLQNYEAGIGDKITLRFDVSSLVGAANSYVELEAAEFDAKSYYFAKPVFTTSSTESIRVKGIRVAINNKVAAAGQAFNTIDTTVTSSPQALSRIGTIIAKDLGADADMFSLHFEILGSLQNVIVEPTPAAPGDNGISVVYPQAGLRTFDQINDTMAALTGVAATTAAVNDTFQEIKQQLPSQTDINTFVSAQQVGIAKLAREYCGALVANTTLRTQFFGATPAFEFGAEVTTAFSTQAKKDIVINKLIDSMVGTNMASQPTRAELAPVLNGLIINLTTGCTAGAAACSATRTRAVVQAACTSVLGSAAVLIQ